MKAIIKSQAGPGIWMGTAERPSIEERDVLIRVKKAAICGTDVHIYKWDPWAQREVPIPTVIGHEFMGEVVEVGAEATGIQVGDRVMAEGHITCGTCRSCRMGERHLCANTVGIGYHRDGAFAEYIAVPARNVFHVPKNVSDDVAALFDPLGNAVHTALSCELVGEDVLITGAGPIGIMAAAVAKFAGARHIVVTDFNDLRLDLAKQMGATATVNVGKEDLKETMANLGISHGFTVGMEMSGSTKALDGMLEAMYPGGHISLLGLLPVDAGINWDNVIFKGLTLKGIYGRKIFGTWYKMSHMIQSGLDITPVITHRLPADEYEKGFQAMLDGSAAKVILDWE